MSPPDNNMIFRGARWLTTTTRAHLDMVSLLKKSIESVEKSERAAAETIRPKVTKPVQKIKKEETISTETLNDKYRSKFKQPPAKGVIGAIHGFFHTTQVKLEWSTVQFLDIPGERERFIKEKELLKKSEDDMEGELAKDEAPENNQSNLFTELPEVVFLGKCNVGKSTLLNSLLTELKLKENKEFAFSSRRAGFTQTMNCFNIGKRFRLIDTPGYGVRGKIEQGEQVLEYLHRRKQLRRVYLLISAKDGFSDDDFTIIDMLVDSGVPFEIVMTKVDLLKSPKIVERHLKESGVLGLPSEPSIIFTNSLTRKKFAKRGGLSELRNSIFEACDLKPGIKPIKFVKNI